MLFKKNDKKRKKYENSNLTTKNTNKKIILFPQ